MTNFRTLNKGSGKQAGATSYATLPAPAGNLGKGPAVLRLGAP